MDLVEVIVPIDGLWVEIELHPVSDGHGDPEPLHVGVVEDALEEREGPVEVDEAHDEPVLAVQLRVEAREEEAAAEQAEQAQQLQRQPVAEHHVGGEARHGAEEVHLARAHRAPVLAHPRVLAEVPDPRPVQHRVRRRVAQGRRRVVHRRRRRRRRLLLLVGRGRRRRRRVRHRRGHHRVHHHVPGDLHACHVVVFIKVRGGSIG